MLILAANYTHVGQDKDKPSFPDVYARTHIHDLEERITRVHAQRHNLILLAVDNHIVCAIMNVLRKGSVVFEVIKVSFTSYVPHLSTSVN